MKGPFLLRDWRLAEPAWAFHFSTLRHVQDYLHQSTTLHKDASDGILHAAELIGIINTTGAKADQSTVLSIYNRAVETLAAVDVDLQHLSSDKEKLD